MGQFHYRKDGIKHAWNPETIATLQLATRKGDYDLFKKYTHLVDDKQEPIFIRDFFSFRKNPISIDKVEPVEEIVKHFVTGAMSFGALSKEAHEAMALAMNALGARSNTGEGGEDNERFHSTQDGISLSSKTKQVASGRFGVDGDARFLFIFCAEVLAHDDACADGHALTETDEQVDGRAAGTHSGQRVAAQKVADDDGVGGVVKLLEQVAQDERHRERGK